MSWSDTGERGWAYRGEATMSSVEDLTREALEAELTSTKAALIDAALIHAKLIQERDEARRDLGAILAVIHRDGGHHTGEHGLSQSVADAHATWASVVRERDTLREEVARLNTLLLSATGENQKRAEREARALEDWRELRAENDRLRAALYGFTG